MRSRKFFIVSGLSLLPCAAQAQEAGDPSVIRASTVVVQGAQNSETSSAAQTVAAPFSSAPGSGWSAITAEVPNFGVEMAGSSPFGSLFTLRGLSNTPYFSDPAVALYFDDIPLGGSFSYPTDLFGIGTASVFLGPQPSLFGRTGEGGTIVLGPWSRPGTGEFSLSYGNFNDRSAGLVENFREECGSDTTLALSFAERDGYVVNTLLDERVDDLHAWTGFVRQRFRPTRSSELSLEVLADRHHDGAVPLVPLSGPLFSVERAEEGETDSALYACALKGTLDTEIGRVTETTSYTHWNLNPYKDWLVLPPALSSSVTQRQSAWNQEVRLSSLEGDAPSWAIGSWLSEGPTQGASDRAINGIIPIEVSGYRETKHEAAVFGEGTLAPFRGLRIILEARAESTRKDYTQDESVPKRGLELRFHRNDEAFLPKISAIFSLAPSTEATLSISGGSKPGGYAAYTDDPRLVPFSPERVVAFEGGIRASFDQGRLVLALRTFDYEIRDYQIERSFSSADYFVANAPRARSTGAEGQASWRLSPSWSVEGSIGVQDVVLNTFHDPLTGRSSDGNKAPYAPSFTARIGLEYRSPKGWFASAQAAEVGRTFYTESEDPYYSQAAYLVLGARAGVEASRWKFTTYVQNAANKGYYTLIIPGVESGAPGAPRTYGAEVALKF